MLRRRSEVVATNRRARHDYRIEETYEAGLVLTGTELKSLRLGRASLREAYGLIDGTEAWLEAVHIPEYARGGASNHEPRRRRKLLLHRKQILRIVSAVHRGGFTIIPLQIYFSSGNAKVEIAIAKGRRQYDKRQLRNDWQKDQDMQQELGPFGDASDARPCREKAFPVAIPFF